MAPNLESGQFKIVSLATEDNLAASVGLTLPGIQRVFLGGPVQTWTVRKDGDSDKLQLSIGGYPFTGVADNKVIASVNPDDGVEWYATYAERHDAYVIAQGNNQSVGWAVNGDGEASEIDVRVIIVGPSYPPFYPAMYLFRFVPANDSE